ncbi:MAG: hypothetical protein R3C68_06280 [Myxococcota bacterium]
MNLLLPRLEKRLPARLRDTAVLRGVSHNYASGTYSCSVQLPDGTRKTYVLDDPEAEREFHVEANIIQAVSEVFHRGSDLRPKYDAWVLLGLWSLASRYPAESAVVSPTGLGVRAFRMKLSVGRLLGEMRYVRRRDRDGRRRRDYDGNDWRKVRQSLERLAEVTVEFRYTVLGPTPKRGKPAVHRRIFKGSLISIDLPDSSKGWWEDDEPPAGREPVFVNLNLYDGIESGYFVLLSRYVFELRPHLDEVDTRLFTYLAYRHRGRAGKKGAASSGTHGRSM